MESRQSQIGWILVIFGGYGAILGYGVLTDTAGTDAIIDVYFGMILLSAVTASFILDESRNKRRRLELVAFLTGGAAFILNGFSMVSTIPSFWVVDSIGAVALMGGCVSIIYRVHFA